MTLLSSFSSLTHNAVAVLDGLKHHASSSFTNYGSNVDAAPPPIDINTVWMGAPMTRSADGRQASMRIVLATVGTRGDVQVTSHMHLLFAMPSRCT
jgi:hypothetical protein